MDYSKDDSLIVAEERFEQRLADEAYKLRVEVEKVRIEIGEIRATLDRKHDKVVKIESNMRLYFLLIILSIVITNPRAIELIVNLTEKLKPLLNLY
ncbi:hypothetical protein MCHI_004056 [Candidatus Magnetoovum chiemensis]|nr:hypothetical protein MCHI_004056 [Candidatus Magnetoovum chiemensis]